MGNVWFMGDCHLGHKNIIKFRPFETEEDHYQTLKRNFNSKVTKRDLVFFMGDVAFTKEALEDVKNNWNGAKKVLIMGNHDLDCKDITIQDLVNTYDEVHALKKYKEFWLSHAPLHPDELRGKVNIHGHVHFNSIDDARYINACPEVWNYGPVSLHEVRQKLLWDQIFKCKDYKRKELV